MSFTEQQIATIDERAPRICVAAGAGSGKTHVLVERIVKLLVEGVDLDGIVAITFTERAAAEMKARLRKRFRELASTRDSEVMSRWRGLERRLDTARISTIHAFCMRLLKENALLLGLDPDFGLLSEPQSRLLVRDTARETVLRLVGDNDPHTMRLASEWSLSRIHTLLTALGGNAPAVLALAESWPLDSGRSLAGHWQAQAPRVLLEEVGTHGVQRKLRNLRRALAAFAGECSAPEKDGREMRRVFYIELIDQLLAGPADTAALLALGDALAAFKPPNGAKKNWSSEEAYEELVALQNKIKDRGLLKRYCTLPDCDEVLEAETAEATIAFVHVLRAFSVALRDAKARRNALDFDDLIARAAHALRDNEVLRNRAASSIDHLLMDEFQDTDHAQLGIANALSGAPGGPHLFVVGDAKQSIYRFRGADVSVFNEVRATANAVLPLARNFRSTPGILSFVNDFFLRSDLLGAVEPVFGELDPHRPESEAPGVEFLLVEDDGDGERVNAKESREAEAKLIADRIRALCAGEPIVWDAKAEAYRVPQPGDFAILLRAMSNVHLYEDALTRAGIEFGVVAGAGFYERQEVIDILNLLKALLDPFDEPALLGVLRGPFCALRDDTLLLLCIDGTPLPRAFFSDVIPAGLLDAEALADARVLLADLRAQHDLPLDALFEYLLNRTLYESLLLGLPGGIQRASNLRKLADVAGEFAASPEPSLRTFVSWLNDMRSAAVREGDAMLQPQEGGAVTLLTVHKSKGLEFPIVILADASGDPRGRNDDVPAHRSLGTAVVPPGAAEGTGKSVWREMINRRNKREEQDEHARLLYVALTRARDYLIVSGSPKPGPGSWLELLDETFGVVTAPDGHALAGAGWRGVVRRCEASAPPTANERTSAPVDWEAEFARVEKQPEFASAPGSITVSELLNRIEAGLGDEEEREPVEQDERRALPNFALLRGSMVHKLFELWQFGKAPAPVDAALAGVGASPDEVKRLRAALQEIAADFEGMKLFTELSNAPGLLREHPFVLCVGQGLVRGTTDAMVAPDTLIDYKTGDFHAERHERYQWQLKLYAAAARALTGTLPTRGLLVYLDAGRVEELAITNTDADEAMALAARVMNEP